MPQVTSYVHGTPSWVDLATPDPAASREFYGALFGWSYDEQSAGERGTYIMCSKGDDAAAGMMQLSEEMSEAGMPPCWSSYVTVEDLDAALVKVEPAGGQVAQPAMDAMDAGRMAVIVDPAGAGICMWEARDHIGAGVVNEHGALIWNELITPDPAAVAPFYEAVFGWTATTMPMPNGEYVVYSTEGKGPEESIAGAMKPPMEGMPAFWGVYFAVDDCDATVALAKEHGAALLAEPISVPGVGRFAAMMDPQGAAVSVMQPESGEG